MRKKSIDNSELSVNKKTSTSSSTTKFDTLRSGVFCSELTEPIPKFIQAACEVVRKGKSNNYIVIVSNKDLI